MNIKSDGLCLDVGCGAQTHPENINLDYLWFPGVDICCNITKGLPLSNGYCSGIFTEHCLEHLPLEDAVNVLREFYRVMAPGAYCRIVVPDFEIYLDTYSQIRNGGAQKMPYGENDYIGGAYCAAIDVNRIMHDHGHRFIYDFTTLGAILGSIGFTEIKKMSFAQGASQSIIFDSEHRAVESLYVECRKPP